MKADDKCKGLLDRFVAVSGGICELTEESAASSTQVEVANSSNVVEVEIPLGDNELAVVASDRPTADVDSACVGSTQPENSGKGEVGDVAVSLETLDLSDIGNWPFVITASFRDSVLQARPAQPPPSNFEYPINNNRKFHPSHFWRKLSNGESFKRSWLIYSQSKDAVFCFCCKLFNVTCFSSLGSTGNSTWKNLARCLHDHEVKQSHLQAMHTYHEAKQRLETSTFVDPFPENATNKHIEYWKKILHRLLAMIQFLA